MQIKYKDVLLRDYRESDIDDEVRWNTVDTQWGLWDAPWEKEDYFRTFDPEAYRQRRLDWLRTKAPKGEELRWFLEIDTAQGVHIGTVSAYLMTEDFQWREHGPDEAPGPDTPVALGWPSATAPTGPAAGGPRPSPPGSATGWTGVARSCIRRPGRAIPA